MRRETLNILSLKVEDTIQKQGRSATKQVISLCISALFVMDKILNELEEPVSSSQRLTLREQALYLQKFLD